MIGTRQAFRVFFALTLPWGLLWVVAIPCEHLLEIIVPARFGISDTWSYGALLGLLQALTVLSLWPGLGPMRGWLLLPEPVPWTRAAFATVLWSGVGYVVFLPISFGLALLFARGNRRDEAGLFVRIFTVWVPLWWALPLGTILAWQHGRRRPAPRPGDGTVKAQPLR